eukprot:60903_1
MTKYNRHVKTTDNIQKQEKNSKLSTYHKIVYIALLNSICAFLILLVVIILVMKSGDLSLKSNIAKNTFQNDRTPTQEHIIINNINHYTTTNISMKPNYTHIFDDPYIGPFEYFDFYHTNDIISTKIPTNSPTQIPTTLQTNCSIGLNRLIDTTTLNGWTVGTKFAFEESDPHVAAMSGEDECFALDPCIWFRGRISWGPVQYNDIWIERILNTSMFNEIKIMIKAATTSMDHIGEYGFIETVCINSHLNVNYTNRTLFNDGYTGKIIQYIGCISVNTMICDSLILRIGGHISSDADLVFVSEVRIFPPINDMYMNSTNIIIESFPNINETISSLLMSETYYAGGWWYGWTYQYWNTYNYAFMNGNNPAGYQINLPFEIHVKYGDKLVFRKLNDWGIDDLLIVSSEMFETCNFSIITDWNNKVTKASASEYWLTDKYGLYDYPYGNNSNWKPFTFNIRKYKINSNSIRDKLLSSNVLYFTSSARWNYPLTSYPSCKYGFKLKVIIEGYKKKENILTVLNSNINSVLDSDEIHALQASIGYLSRTALLQQFSDEQRIRSEGDSGLTNVRGYYDGERAYDDGTYSNDGVASIHDHTDFIRVVGIGEISAVLNGVEFQTRHNDYN